MHGTRGEDRRGAQPLDDVPRDALLRFTRKEKRWWRASYARRRSQPCGVASIEQIQAWDPERLIFIDESGSHVAMTRTHGWGPLGQRVHGIVPRHPNRRHANVRHLHCCELRHTRGRGRMVQALQRDQGSTGMKPAVSLKW